MKRVFIMALMAAALTTAGAQEKKGIQLPSWLSNVKLSGYGMLQYQYGTYLFGRSHRTGLLLEDPDTVQWQHLDFGKQPTHGGSLRRVAEI